MSYCDLIIENQNDEFTKKYSTIVKIIYKNTEKTYYVPYIIMKQINKEMYQKNYIEIKADTDETDEIFLNICRDIFNNNRTILINSKIQMDKYYVSQKICPSFYNKIITKVFKTMDEFKNYEQLLSQYPECYNSIMNIYYSNEESLFLYKIMENLLIDIPTDLLNSKTICVETNENYDIHLISKFGNICYFHKCYGMIYTSILKDEFKYYVKGPYSMSDGLLRISMWENIKSELNYDIYKPYCNKISFTDSKTLAFSELYEYIMGKQDDNAFISKTIKVIVSDDNNKEIIYLPKSILKKIDKEYYYAIKNIILSGKFSTHDFEIYLSQYESIDGFMQFLHNFLNNNVYLKIESKKDIEIYATILRFNKQNRYYISTHLEIHEYFDLLFENISLDSLILENLILLIIKAKHINIKSLLDNNRDIKNKIYYNDLCTLLQEHITKS